jgi:tripartite-type tricarboxylate transporter receptor subunit TctC
MRKHIFKALSNALFTCMALGVCAASNAYAQDNWPSRPIKLMVPYAAGGSTDIVSRLVAAKLTEELGQQVVVENRGGAGGSIGAAAFAKGGYDDHYFLMVTQSQLSINQFLFKDKLGYDPVADLQPVSLVAQTTNAIVVTPSLPVKSLKEFLDYAKSHPGKVAYSSAGVGSTGHLLNELIKTSVGIDMVHVPYKGNGPAMQAVVAGDVQTNTDNMPQLLAQIRAGKVRPLAVTTAKRWFQLPDVPTVDELGFPDLKTTVWFAMVAQSKMPKDIVMKMNQALQKVLRKPDFVASLRQQSLEATPSTPEELLSLAESDRKKWKKVVETSGATLE